MSKDDVVYNVELCDRKPKPDLQGWAFLLSLLWHFLKTVFRLCGSLWILDTLASIDRAGLQQNNLQMPLFFGVYYVKSIKAC